MFGGHIYELIIVLVIALVVFGPKRLPELGSSIGKGIREFRKATNELHDSIKTDGTEALPPEQPHYTASDYTASDYVARPRTNAATTARHAPAGAEYTATPAASAEAHADESETPRA
jgi:sec-independent protein translocase protein TatA